MQNLNQNSPCILPEEYFICP